MSTPKFVAGQQDRGRGRTGDGAMSGFSGHSSVPCPASSPALSISSTNLHKTSDS